MWVGSLTEAARRFPTDDDTDVRTLELTQVLRGRLEQKRHILYHHILDV